MARAKSKKKIAATRARKGGASSSAISRIGVKGFKSTRDGLEIELRPLTILAGQNSAGKSSIVQPLLLLKQTLEAVHDPGALELNGPCVKFNEASQLLWHGKKSKDSADFWEISLTIGSRTIAMRYCAQSRGGFRIAATRETKNGTTVEISEGMTQADLKKVWEQSDQRFIVPEGYSFYFSVLSDRCSHALEVSLRANNPKITHRFTVMRFLPIQQIESIIHLPGLRGHPEREYPVTRSAGRYPGTFPPYVASVLLDWSENDDSRLSAVGRDLQELGLTWKVVPNRLHDTHVELRVGRLPRSQQGGAKDLVNIADVGFGASQVLPVVVALRAARNGQLVHIEQPELHLHPNAQVAMADLLVDAARRGVRLLVETHSSILLKRLQGLVASTDNDIGPEMIALHWFTRNAEGVTEVTTAQVDEQGGYGDWPVDFADVEMQVEQQYIEAAIARMSRT